MSSLSLMFTEDFITVLGRNVMFYFWLKLEYGFYSTIKYKITFQERDALALQ